ncbi:MAG: hypothetical protein H0U70_02860 [Tatlockia sp.]|nr:hypothetical protein [Tatlockia sp.]
MFSKNLFIEFLNLSEKEILLKKIISLHDQVFKLRNLSMQLANDASSEASEIELGQISERLFLTEYLTGLLRDQVKKSSQDTSKLSYHLDLYDYCNSNYENLWSKINNYPTALNEDNQLLQTIADPWIDWSYSEEENDFAAEENQSSSSEVKPEIVIPEQSSILKSRNLNLTTPKILANNLPKKSCSYSGSFFYSPLEIKEDQLCQLDNILEVQSVQEY